MTTTPTRIDAEIARASRHGLRLRPYQYECVEAVVADLADPELLASARESARRAGNTRAGSALAGQADEPQVFPHLAVVLPTGSGKTVVFSALGDTFRSMRPGSKVMILAHRDELISQTVTKYRDVVPGARIGVIKAERHETGGNDVLVASVQSLNAARRERTPRPDLLVIDEAHHASSKSYRAVIDWAQCPVVGVTATLSRSDGKALGRAAGGVFDKISYQKSILWMIRNGYLCDVKGQRVVVDDLDLQGMRTVAGDYSDHDVSERLLGSSAPAATARAIREIAPDQPGVIFAPTVESAHAFTEAMRAEGFTCETVWGAMPLDRDTLSPLGVLVQKSRRRIRREFERGEIDWLSNCMVLTEGWDAPRATVAVIARATQSTGLYVQMAGRVLRPFPGKDHALILDVVGATRQHELATLAVLAGDVPRDTKSRTLLDLYGAPCESCDVPRDECLWAEGSPCCENCSHAGLDVDGTPRPIEPSAFRSVEADLFAGGRQRWLVTKAGYWFISAGKRLIAIAPRPDDGYDVIWCNTDAKGGGYVTRAVDDLAYAMAQGETEITLEEETFARKEGGWRRKRATEAQIKYARLLGCYTTGMESLRAGAVGDVISIAKASARLDRMIAKRLENT